MAKEKAESPVSLSLVLGYIAVKDLATIEKKVLVLGQLGYSNQEMVRICGATQSVVRALKSRTKKGR